MSKDPADTIATSPMTRFQIMVIMILIFLNGLDGFDVLAISFAAPGIAEEWGIDRSMLGFVLAMELIGMGIGSLLLGSVADRYGRRPLMLGCLVMMMICMLAAAGSSNLTQLMICRVLTGLGIGGMLTAINAATAEFSNTRSRSTAVSLKAAGYPVGAVLGGAISAWLLQSYDWRAVFYFGGAMTGLAVPLVWYCLPETVAFLAHRQPPGALAKINRTLARMGHAQIDQLPALAQADSSRKQSAKELFRQPWLPVTLLVVAAYFAHVATFYFPMKWIPKIIVDMGYLASSAAGVLVWANIGGALGGVALGLLVRRWPLIWLAAGAMVISIGMVNVFGQGQANLQGLALIAALTGFFTNAGLAAMYAIAAQVFPTRLRASGTGLMIGIGRGGAALSPIIAGFLFEGGFGLAGVALMMSAGSLLAVVLLVVLKMRKGAMEG